ncbi:putative actin-binding protein [Diplogelasinospora grovesii]|uniref:Actin-binding protein n=1 Tax=Diplogelasinospora grovesii TaxID=303347 RepID=A0AAN6NEQ9_9PEZI|nr:putative actin-binding protein [Diplogelasinospora grovesii]
MVPHDGLVHLKEYGIKDSNVELINTEIDHKVKYASSTTEPAWNNGHVGLEPGLWVWRIEDFCVVPIPTPQHGVFYEGDSYIILHSNKVGSGGSEKLGHDIFFWLGSQTSQDEAGTATYKTVELDEHLHGAAVQHRELQANPSEEFLALFPRLTIRRGGVASGFRHVQLAEKGAVTTLLRVFKPASGRGTLVVVHEVEPSWESLDEDDVFVLDKGEKLWVWQGRKCSPMDKAKAAQVVHDMVQAKHVDVEVLSQTESRSRIVVKMLGGENAPETFEAKKPLGRGMSQRERERERRLWRLSDSSGQLSFDLVREGEISKGDLKGEDVFLLDDSGKAIWVWEGKGASKTEKAMWLRVAQSYVRKLQSEGDKEGHMTPIARVQEGGESVSFLRAVRVV